MNGLGKFRVEKLRTILGLMERMVVRQRVDISMIGNISILEPAEPRFDCPVEEGDWRRIAIGQTWGAKSSWAYFRSRLTVPAQWQGGATELHMSHSTKCFGQIPEWKIWTSGLEGQVFINGKRVGAIDRKHKSIRHPFEPGKTYDIRAVFFAAHEECRHELEEFALAWVDTATAKLYHDLRVAMDIAEQLEKSSLDRENLIATVDAAIYAVDIREINEPGVSVEARHEPVGESFYASVPTAQKIFDKVLSKLQPSNDIPAVVALGHAHIDLGWLWPIEQTHHKCVRTFATQCRLLDQYDHWIFNQSSPQAYAWVEQDAPELFERICKYIATGRWEAEGATWCETDTNLPSGESLVRQFLYGKTYFKDKFGLDSRLLWMPDVFGYSAAMPQIAKLAGVDACVTSKISWNQYNPFPHDTFRWRGLDGSDLLTHFITTPVTGVATATYNGMLNAKELRGVWQVYKQKRHRFSPLLTFGYGDGGGGPTEFMLETAERLAEMPCRVHLPKIEHCKAGDLLKRIAPRREELPVWDGELYLEYHRGTYTTQAWLKRANRKNEIRLHNVEWLASLASDYGYKLDKAKLDTMWQNLLLCQFHDILPGSSINELYCNEVRPMQQQIADQAEDMVAGVAEAICSRIHTSDLTEPVVLFNTLSWERRDPVQLPNGSWREDIKIPAGGWTVVDAVEPPTAGQGSELLVGEDGRELLNKYWKLRLDDQGRIAELYDRMNDRQILAEGVMGNEWQVFTDRTAVFDAWEIELYYQDHPLPGPVLTSIQEVEKNNVRIAVELNWQMPRIGQGPQSSITQRIALYANHPRIDFETAAVWHEHHQLLKVAFPVNIRTTEASYEIQFGHIRRPTHRNTSWDLARFECCAHRFVDLSEYGYGVSLLNDCKYGHDIHENVIRLTCIKCPQSPDPQADQGNHQFTYSLLPHIGTFQDAGVIRAAAELNCPPIMRRVRAEKGELPRSHGFVQCDSQAVIVDTIKPAEDGKGLIVRLYESHGSHAKANLSFTTPFKKVQSVNLLEQPREENIDLEHRADQISLRLRPFQLVTLRLTKAL